jgi:cleavage and polyadenylation specificity factor subunit 1
VSCHEAVVQLYHDASKLNIKCAAKSRYMVNLSREGGSSIKFRIEKMGAGVLPSCLCKLGEGFLFLGSRLADSLLVKYAEKRATVDEDSVCVSTTRSNFFFAV